MDSTIDISWIDLIIGHSLLAIPVVIFLYYKTELVKSTLIAALRMAVQLILIGIYLEYMFKWDNNLINAAWVLLMVMVAAGTITQRSGLKYRFFVFPNFISVLISLVLIDAFFLGFIVKLNNVFEARYLIPVTGMILGNAMQNNIIAMNSFYSDLKEKQFKHRYLLASGATKGESLVPFFREALKKAFNPTIARMAVIGLISLPGTMTGQIIGGSSPSVAIKYQIMLMIAIFTSSILSVFLSLVISNRFVFDRYHNLRNDIFIEKKDRSKNLSEK
ncbi:MAG: ABC transporter permease [Bacteroidota bacterium]